ncbi:sigma-70 family RNA polymerase sigma factor [Modestobacter sp. I12A-02662]|uniref:sigma-70 family RNA polymerase sigma factor n=1 Tax=Modestobacter sp. I12A-02662 TaxID=1730496 RepID=UPI0034DE7C48
MTSRDEHLVRALYAEHAAALWSFVVPLVDGDRARAQDVVQETMLRAWRRPEVLGQARGSVRPWLFTVARHLVIDEWRRHRTDRDVPLDAGAEVGADDGTDAVLDSWIVGDALARLSPQHRAVIEQCYFQGRTTADAAAVLGIPEGTVKSRAHYALRALRVALQEMGVTA